MSRVGRRLAGGLVVAAMVLAAACSADEDATVPEASDAAAAFAGSITAGPVAAGTSLEPGEVAHDIGTSFQYQSFVITVGVMVHDADAGQLRLGLRFANVSAGWAQTDATAELELGDGTSVPVAGDLFEVPPGVAVDVTAIASSVPEDPVADGVVTWGRPSFDQPVFRLDGTGGDNLWLPATFPLDGWTQIGKFGIHLTGVQVNASKLDLGIQAEAGERILRVFVEEYTARGSTSPFDARSNLLLRLPSGEELDAVDGSPMANQLSWTAQGGQWAEFEIPADVDGAYELLLASVAKVGFSTLQPELIERRAIPFELTEVAPGPPPELVDLAFPMPYPPAPEGAGEAFTVDLDVGSMNVPGYDVEPTRLAYDPVARTATVDATVTSLVSAAGPDDGILSAEPTFGFRLVLASGGRLATGVVEGSGLVDADVPTELRFQFSDVRRLTPDGAGLYIGPGNGAVASMPFGAASTVPAWPPAPVEQLIEAPEITAGDWTVRLQSYRLGLFNPSSTPELGRRQLEISLKVTTSPSAQVRALGLSFRPIYQVLLGSGTGYDQGAVADSGLVELTPGQSITLTVAFDVADSFQGGRVPFVVRSRAEFAEIFEFWVESRFEADLTAAAASDEAGF